MWLYILIYEYIGCSRSRKLKPIVVDPGLFLEEEDEVFYATQKRELPDAYRLFSGQMVVAIFSTLLMMKG